MSGLGVLAWIAIGATAGWTLGRLMVGAEDDALRGTAAGMIGAILGGLGIGLLDPLPAPGNHFDTSVAALAGSLWLTWTTCVVTSGRHARGTDRAPVHATRHDRTDHVEAARSIMTYAEARGELVEQLLRDAMAHDAGRYHDVGRRFENIERGLPRGGRPDLGRLRVALTFWDGWIDARNRGWQQPDGGIAKTEWPLLARGVAADLEGNRDVTDARVTMHFDTAAAYPRPASRVQVLAARLRAG
jgi:uncharacterized membrane protein YeaQ/YmgE (transglycosylase-associated protein family)